MAILLPAHALNALESEDSQTIKVLPGDARAISHSTSASRDVGVLSYQVLPRVVLSTGCDFAFFGFHFTGLELRLGMFGLVEVETKEPHPASFMNVPGGTYLWRGLLGYSMALSSREISEKFLGSGGLLEFAISFRHESEHFTGTREGGEPLYPEVPNIGDFVMPDMAARWALGPVDLEIRTQLKIFLKTKEDYAYSLGAGGDLVLRWRAHRLLHPFLSVFLERLFGKEVGKGEERRTIPDNTLVRGLLGIVVPGEAADMMLFAVASHGNGKGLLAFEEHTVIGWGIRVAFLKRSPIDSNRGHSSSSPSPIGVSPGGQASIMAGIQSSESR